MAGGQLDHTECTARRSINRDTIHNTNTKTSTKKAYDARLAEQRAAAREVAALLQRRGAWAPADVARFAEVYGAEAAGEAAAAAARARHEAAQAALEAAQGGLVAAIRERYAGETLWSDKVRRAATWWTWGLLAAQGASVVAVYAVLEPRRRAALQRAVADLVEAQGAALGARLDALMVSPGNSGGGSEVAAQRPLGAAAGTTAAAGTAAASGGGGNDGTTLLAAVEALRAATARLDAALAASAGDSRGGGDGDAAASASVKRQTSRPARRRAVRLEAAAPPSPPREPRNAAERWAWQVAAAGRQLAARCGSALAPLLQRACPEDELTLSRGQAAGLAAAGAAVGGAATWLLLLVAGARGGGGGGGSGAGGGGSSSAGMAAG